jgi:deferrochelatase/peroxidase EfeB
VSHPPDPAAYQSGITNRPPEHCVVGAFRLNTTEPVATSNALEELRRVVSAELRSDLDNQSAGTDKSDPSPETGELGFDDGHDRAHLTITFGLGSTGFDKLGIAIENRPQDLVPIPWAELGDNPAQPEQGDLVLQVCSDDAYICEHAIRRVEEELREQMTLLWTQIGSQRYTTRQGRTNRSEGRAVIGFIDGTSNLNPRRNEDDARLVFVDPNAVQTYPSIPAGQPPGYGGAPGTAFPANLRQPPAQEPAWTRFGTYMTVRSSTIDITAWDQASLGEQEQNVGRFKLSGTSLDLTDDPAHLNDPPAFEGDQSNTTVPVDSHARKSNPRRPEDLDRRIFRRGYPLIAGSTDGFDRGLLFISFGRTLSTQFEFIFRAWMRNANFPSEGAGPDRLFQFESGVLAGGYYFVPPLEHRTRPWSWIIPS